MRCTGQAIGKMDGSVSLPLKGHLRKKEQSDNVDAFFSQDDDDVEPEDEPSEGTGQAQFSDKHTYFLQAVVKQSTFYVVY